MNPEIKPKFLLTCFHCESLFHQRNCAYRPSPLLNLNFCQRECRYNWTNYAKEVLGTAMTNAEEEEVTAPVRASEPTIKYMLKLPAKHLKELALVHSIDPELSVREIAYRLCGFVQAPLVELQQNNQPQTQVPSSSSSANSQSTTSSSSATLSTAEPAPNPVPTLSPDSPASSEWNEEAIRLGLSTLPLKDLKMRAKKLGIQPKSKQSELVEQFLLGEMPVHRRASMLEECYKDIDKSITSPKKPFVHQTYKERFNAVDTFDRRIYDLYRTHKTLNWRFTAILGLHYAVLCNLHAFSEESVANRELGVGGFRSNLCNLKQEMIRDFLKPIFALKKANLIKHQ